MPSNLLGSLHQIVNYTGQLGDILNNGVAQVKAIQAKPQPLLAQKSVGGGTL